MCVYLLREAITRRYLKFIIAHSFGSSAQGTKMKRKNTKYVQTRRIFGETSGNIQYMCKKAQAKQKTRDESMKASTGTRFFSFLHD